MIADRDDLGLSLSLSCSKTTSNKKSMKQKKHCPVQLKLMPCLQSSLWSAADGAEEEEGGVSSANSTVSCLSGKHNGGELDIDRRGMSEEEEDGDAARKKLRLSKEQSAVLEDSFKENHTLNPMEKVGLARRLGVRPRQVEVWFQNRRARTKLKQTELDCELMKKWCSQLAEENRRLHNEIEKLRALNHLSPQFYITTPATTLTMCPSCHKQRRSPVRPIHR